LSPEEFYRMTWAEYDLMCEGYAGKQERQSKERWEIGRWITFHLLNVQLERKNRLKRFTDLTRFPWEKAEHKGPQTPEEWDEDRRKFEELKKKWGETLA